MKNSPKTINNLCKKHAYKSYIAFCKECNQHLCELCFKGNTHKNHIIKQISTKKISIDISAITKISNSIKEKCKELIKLLEDKIKQINKAYNKYYDNQTAIITYLKELVYTYNNCSNYYNNENINQIGAVNSNFTLPNNFDSINEDVINNFIKFLQSYSVMKKKEKITMDNKQIINTKTINDHSDIGNSLIMLKDKRIASSSQDNTIKIFDTNNNYHCDITIKGHNDYVTSIAELDNGNIASCSWDYSIKIWSISKNSYKCLSTIRNAHQNWILKIVFVHPNRIASISTDETIKIWTFDKNEIKLQKQLNSVINPKQKELFIAFYTLGCSIYFMQNKNFLISGTEHKELMVWDMEDYQRVNIVENVGCYWSNAIYQYDNDRVIVGGRNMFYVVFIDRVGSWVEYSYSDSSLGFVLSFLKLFDNDTILCGCEGGKLLRFNLKTNAHSFVERTHVCFINDILSINDMKILTCSTDETIKEWVIK